MSNETIIPYLTDKGTYMVEMTHDQITELNYCLKLVANQRRVSREYATRKREEKKILEKESKQNLEKHNSTFYISIPEIPKINKSNILPPKVPSPVLKIIN